METEGDMRRRRGNRREGGLRERRKKQGPKGETKAKSGLFLFIIFA